MAVPQQRPRRRCKHTRSHMIIETLSYEIWHCDSCHRRTVRTPPQTALFTQSAAREFGRQLELFAA